MNPVRRTTLKVVKEAKEVKINQEKVKKLAKKWLKQKIAVPAWPKEKHLETENQRKMLDYLIILDSLNFCFWPPFQRGQPAFGYFALALNLKKFFEENPKKANLNYFSKIPQKEFYSVFSRNLQYLKKRWQIARAVSWALIKKYQNSENFLKSAQQKFSILVSKIYKELPYFDDIAFYNGQKIYFLKRAQILAADIWGAFGNREIGYFKDLDYLTCFADYKIPQILNYFGILEYSPNLEKKIKNKIFIPVGSKKEIEIRSCTIWAVEYLREALKNKFYSFEIDWILWKDAQKKKAKMPHHLTKTIFY